MNRVDNTLLRVGIFYDGTYFAHISDYYSYFHERKARLSIRGIHEFVRDEISRQEGVEKRFCQIVDAHYFRGRLSAKRAQENGSLYGERQFDEVLIREGITMHFLPLATNPVDGSVQEKGIDVWFALEAYELAVHKRFDICVIVTGDSDLVPLVRKLNTLGTRVMLLAWNFDGVENRAPTRTSQALIHEVTYPVMMSDVIDDPSRQEDPVITGLFAQKNPSPEASVHKPPIDTQDETLLKTGTIVNFFHDDGYGFIQPEGGRTREENFFFHISSVAENVAQTDLVPGTAVRFYPGKNDKGGPVAWQISLLQ